MSSLVALAAPGPEDGVFEPHLAIDSSDPQRVAVVATYPSTRLGVGHDIWCWRTEDGGKTWSDGPVTVPRLDDKGLVADPLVVYGPDGELIVTAVTLEYFDVAASFAAQTRSTSPTSEEINSMDYSYQHMIALGRSTDHGETWEGTIVPNSRRSDREAVAADVHPSSRYRGHVYVAWSSDKQMLAFARSVDGGRIAEPAMPIGKRNGFVQSQLLVGRDGTVHLLWIHPFGVLPDAEEEEAGRGIFYARSDDGGATFEERGLVVEHGGMGRVTILSAGIASDGALLAVWIEADEIAPERGTQSRQTLRFAHSADGRRWSAARTLCQPPADRAQGLPAVAATGDAWHVLSYDADDNRTTVRIYSSPLDKLEFQPSRELATRPFGMQDIWLGSSFQLRAARDLVIVGDYVGLAGAGSTLASAIVLPEGDAWPGFLRAFATIAQSRT